MKAVKESTGPMKRDHGARCGQDLNTFVQKKAREAAR